MHEKRYYRYTKKLLKVDIFLISLDLIFLGSKKAAISGALILLLACVIVILGLLGSYWKARQKKFLCIAFSGV